MKSVSHKSRRFLLALLTALSINSFSQTIIYSESFSSSSGGWTVTSTGSETGAWVRGSNSSHSTGATGNYFYSQKYSSQYNNNTYITATSPAIDLTGYNAITLALKVWYKTESSWDGMKIEYSLNNGSSWSDLGTVSSSNWYNDSGINAFNTYEDGWSGNSSGWQTKTINLSTEDIGFEFATQARFRILFASDYSNTDIGVAFDEISISGTESAYCSATSSICDEYISRVQVGSINNTSSCSVGGYADYTGLSANMTIGTGYPITISNGLAYVNDQCGIWVDWNQDGDFLDANETITISGGPTTFTATLTPPTGATIGTTRLRIRIKYTGAVSSCGNTTYGEVEDYSINVSATTSISTGTISPTNYCAGSTISVPYTITGTFTSGNVFTAQLSNASGSFASPISIGTLTSTTAGSISATIPLATLTGTGYRIRVVSSNPAVTGTNNGSNITINTTPTITGTTPNSRCGTGTVTLGATASAGTINWYAASTGGTSLGTGTSFTSPSISSTTTYYVEATNGSCTTATRTAVIATINTIPTITGTTPNSRCGTGTVTLGATASAGTINWYAASTGGTSLGTGTSFTSPSISSTTTYYVEATNGSCTTATRTSVKATINSIPSAPTVGPITQPNCAAATGSVVLNDLPAGTWTLTRNPGGIKTTGTGSSKTITGLTPGTYTYTVTAEDNSTSCPGSGTGLFAEYFNNTTLTAPAALTRTDATVNFNWTSGNPGSPINNDGFSARWTGKIQPCYTENYTFSTNSDDGIRLWINGVQIINNWTNHVATINNSAPISLTAGTKYDIVLEYYENTGLAVAQLYWSSASQSYQIIPQNQSYSVATGCTSTSSVNIVINTQPTTPTITGTTPNSRCGTGTVTLGATASTGTINWYAASTGGTSLGTGTSFTTPSISSTTTYYVEATNGSCTTATRTAVTATVNTIPTITGTTPATRCGTGSVTLGATASAGTINWYAASTGGTSLGTGTSFTTPSISSTTTYWVDASDGCTTLTRTAVIATINKNYWTGDADSNWNNPANWCAGVPTNGIEVTLNTLIPSGLANYPVISATDTPGYVKTIVLENNTTLTIIDNSLQVTENLKLNGKIDLEGESQLIQTLGSTLDPTSSGVLERDQQGTADTYTYNYWSSPVGLPNNTTNNNSYKLPDIFQGVNFLTTGYNGTASPLGISDYWIWKFSNKTSGDYSQWQHVRSTGTMLAGEGFTMKGPGTGSISTLQNYVLLGKPNNGDINLAISAGNEYLVGNPYPCALDADQFILDNGPTIAGPGSTTGTLYFWEHWGGGSHYLADYQGGYATYSLSGGVPAASLGTNDPMVATGGTPTKLPGRYIPVAQGFFVSAENSGTIKFNNGQRVFQIEDGSNSLFIKQSNTKKTNSIGSKQQSDNRTKLRLGFNSASSIRRQILATVDQRATINYDWGFDSKYIEEQADDMYWMISKDKYVIQGINEITPETILPLGIHTKKAGEIKITIDKIENETTNLNIYLHDKVLNIYHDLKQSDYKVSLNIGTYLNRFEITFSNKSEQLALNVDENLSNVMIVFYSNEKSSIVIQNPNSTPLNSVELYNILGQLVYQFNKIENENYIELKTTHLQAGTYTIKLNTSENEISKKVLIK